MTINTYCWCYSDNGNVGVEVLGVEALAGGCAKVKFKVCATG